MHRGAGTGNCCRRGEPEAALLGLKVPKLPHNRTSLLDRVYITEARRPEECEEGSGSPDRDDRGRLTD